MTDLFTPDVFTSIQRWMLAVVAAIPAAACSDGATIVYPEPPAPGMSDGSMASEGSAGDGGQAAPLYLVRTTVSTDDTDTGYIASVPSLDEGRLPLDAALEYPGDVRIGGIPGTGVFFAASRAEPTIDKWRIEDDGSFELLGTLSLANLGLSDLTTAIWTSGGAVFESAERAYFVSFEESHEIVIWNPDAMQLIETVPIPDEYLEYQGEGVFERRGMNLFGIGDGTALLTINWGDPENSGTRWARHSTHFTFDPQTRTFSAPFDEPRCSFPQPRGVAASDGTLYFSPITRFVLPGLVFGNDFGDQPSGLRVVPPGQRFDDGYDVDLSALVGGRPAGNFTPVSDELAFILVWHPELVPELTPENWATARREFLGYRWWTWRIGDAEALDNVEQEPHALGSGANQVVDGRVLGEARNPDDSARLIELRADGTLRPGLSAPGNMEVLRVR
jgi:hypothetical protein